MKRKSFTLVELTISITILAIMLTTSMATFANIVKSRERISQENMLYNEARLTMLSLTKAISENVIDYSEYFNRNVLAGNFGNNYEAYYTRFLDPGAHCDVGLSSGTNEINYYTDGAENDLGKCCYDASSGAYLSEENCIGANYDDVSVGNDTQTGVNPYNGYEGDASAFCSNQVAYGSMRECKNIENIYENEELYLISEDGRKKIIFGREYINDKEIYTVSYAVLNGTDTNNDGVIDLWKCAEEFDCTGPSDTPSEDDFLTPHDEGDFENYFSDFVPISSSNINIYDLKFYISPIEDPNLAYEEINIGNYPIVTVILEARLTDTEALVNKNLNIRLQTTISPKYEEVKSYR